MFLVSVAASGAAGVRAQDAPPPPDQAQAVSTGTAFLYRGTLTRAGVGYTGVCAMTFRLWDTATAGAPTTPEYSAGGVVVQAGAFEVVLDFGETAFTGPARWLETAVQCDSDPDPTTLTPRQALWPVPYAIYAGSTSWAGVLDLPAGFADGVDNDTIYTAGAGLTLTGNQFAVAPSVARLTDILPTVEAGGYITRTLADQIYSYTAGPGLVLTGTEFAVDGSIARVSDILPTVEAGGYITRTLAETLFTYTAGDGLTLTGNEFAVDGSIARVSDILPTVEAGGYITKTLADATYQARITGTCAAGNSIRTVNADGSVVCEADDNTTYTAGAGLWLTGTTFSANTGVVQARVTGSCTAGQKITAIAADGSVTCGTDADSGGDITGVTAGTGLTGGGTTGGVTLNVDTTTTQARVTGTCAAGSSISAIAQNGTVTCEADTDTTYSAGTGLTLAGTTFNANTSVLQARVTGTCTAGQKVLAINADGTVTCGTDADSGGDITDVTAGTGLSGGSTSGSATLSVNTSSIQARVTGSCTTGSYVRAIAADGTVTCENGYLSGMAARAYVSAASNLGNVCYTAQRVGFGGEEFDTGGLHSGGRLTAPATGVYSVGFNLRLAKDAGAGDVDSYIWLARSDGKQFARTMTWIQSAGATARGQSLIRLTAGQWVDVMVLGGWAAGSCDSNLTAVAETGTESSEFYMSWVSP